VRLGRCKDEDDVGWGLFQSFKECVERGAGEHVNLVHDVDFVFGGHGGVFDFFDYVADVFHAVV